MISDVQNLIKDYPNWLADNTGLTETKDYTCITTPFLDRHNDYLQIYIEKNGSDFILTDDGYTIADLSMCGCDFDTPNRKEILKTSLAGYGVILKDNELTIKASAADFSEKKHMLVQAMLTINDLFYIAQPHIKSLFLEDVKKWLHDKKIAVITDIKLTGKTGYIHAFDFAIPGYANNPERFIKTINHPDKTSIMSAIMMFLDVKDIKQLMAITLINDQISVKKNITSPLENYNIKPILWSERENATHLLAS